MHICFIVDGYPTPRDPYMAFVRNTVAGLARQGVTCSVIAPQSLTRALAHRVPVRPLHWQDTVAPGVVVQVWQPLYITLSRLGGRFNIRQALQAAKRAYRRVRRQPIDALYGHFWHMGVEASLLDPAKPLFVACGESQIQATRVYTAPQVEAMLDQLAGAIYVSSKTYQESLALGLQRPGKPYVILPNGYDPQRFYPMDRQAARQKLGWPADAVIAVFVGAFVPRKGADRVARALTEVNRTRPVYSCFIGAGPEAPVCPNQLHVGKVDNGALVTYLNAADFFVLPTTNEGCCNAIIEAMACGLPILSSVGAFNDDILTPANAIRIDPMDTDALAAAIRRLAEEPQTRRAMGAASLEQARTLTLEQRIRRLKAFVEENLPAGH